MEKASLKFGCQKIGQRNRTSFFYHAKLPRKQINSTQYTHFFSQRGICTLKEKGCQLSNSKPILSIISNQQEHFRSWDFCPTKEIFHKDIFSDLTNLQFHQLLCCYIHRLVSLPRTTNYVCEFKNKSDSSSFLLLSKILLLIPDIMLIVCITVVKTTMRYFPSKIPSRSKQI